MGNKLLSQDMHGWDNSLFAALAVRGTVPQVSAYTCSWRIRNCRRSSRDL